MDRNEIEQRAYQELASLLEGRTDKGHGADHALVVKEHCDKAMADNQLSEETKLEINLAALLHDADDRKIFGPSKGYPNARKILKGLALSNESCNRVLEMISLVSCSTNGNNIPEGIHEYQLYPRLADRLEAIGEIGILRCYYYTVHVSRPLFNEDTPTATTKEELSDIATPERFQEYLDTKKSMSFIDHFYDKILHIGNFKTNNKYFTSEAKRRMGVIEEFIIGFGRTPTEDYISRRVTLLEQT